MYVLYFKDVNACVVLLILFDCANNNIETQMHFVFRAFASASY